MATEVLHSRDLLAERFRVAPTTAFHRRRHVTPNPNPANLSLNRRQQRKVSPKHDNRSRSNAAAASEAEAKKSNHGGGLVMGQVTLLKRGEPLPSISPKEPVQTPAVLGNVSSPEIVLKQIRLVTAPPADNYAGSGMFTTSPSPRSVPLPSFFSKKEANSSDLFEDDATRDLRRILRLG